VTTGTNTPDAPKLPPSYEFNDAVADPGADAHDDIEPADTAPSSPVVDVEEPARLTPIKAIREKCLECSGGSRQEVRYCPITRCALWPYRLGKRPAATLALPSGRLEGS
jgi:hypothetical protein